MEQKILKRVQVTRKPHVVTLDQQTDLKTRLQKISAWDRARVIANNVMPAPKSIRNARKLVNAFARKVESLVDREQRKIERAKEKIRYEMVWGDPQRALALLVKLEDSIPGLHRIGRMKRGRRVSL